MLSANELFSVRVKTVRFKEGYNADQIDDFLEEVVQSLKWLEAGQIVGPNGEIPMGPEDVRNRTFDTTKYDSAYDMRQVDDLLREIARTLEHYVRVFRGAAVLGGPAGLGGPAPSPGAPGFPTTTPSHHSPPVMPGAVPPHTTGNWTPPPVGYPGVPVPPHSPGAGRPLGSPPAGSPPPVQSVDFPVNAPQARPVPPPPPGYSAIPSQSPPANPVPPPPAKPAPPQVGYPPKDFPTVGY